MPSRFDKFQKYRRAFPKNCIVFYLLKEKWRAGKIIESKRSLYRSEEWSLNIQKSLQEDSFINFTGTYKELLKVIHPMGVET